MSSSTSAKEIIESRKKPMPELPLLGVKDFEPDGSKEQSHLIEKSVRELKSIISYNMVKSLNNLSQAVWRPELHLAEVTHQAGSHWTYMGHTRGQQFYIYPEEALYLLETGALEIIYNEVPISVQRAYFVLFEQANNSDIEKYRVYSLLSSHGYKVLRHSPQNTVTTYEKKIEIHKINIKLKNCNNIINTGKREAEPKNKLSEISKKQKVSNEMAFSVFFNKNCESTEILKRIQVIQPYNDSQATELTFDFDIYSDMFDKQTFKKSCLQLPTFRVIIHRGEDPMPDLNDLCKLANKYKDEIPVIHAVVFRDYIAFYRINSVVLPDVKD